MADGLVAGATVPQAAPLHPAPAIDQVTPLFAESFATEAMKVWVAPTCTLAVVADIVTATVAEGGVPLPVGLVDPAQPATKLTTNRTAIEVKRGARPVRNRFTGESPKI